MTYGLVAGRTRWYDALSVSASCRTHLMAKHNAVISYGTRAGTRDARLISTLPLAEHLLCRLPFSFNSCDNRLPYTADACFAPFPVWQHRQREPLAWLRRSLFTAGAGLPPLPRDYPLPLPRYTANAPKTSSTHLPGGISSVCSTHYRLLCWRR